MPPTTKKKPAISYSWQRQNRQGFLRFYPLKLLVLAALKKQNGAKPLQSCIIVLLTILKNCYQNKYRHFRLSPT